MCTGTDRAKPAARLLVHPCAVPPHRDGRRDAPRALAGSRPSVFQVEIDEMRDGAGMADRIRGGDEGDRGQHHLVVWLDALEQQRGMKRRGAVDDRDRMPRAGRGRDHVLEAGDILAGRRHPVGVDAIEHEFALALRQSAARAARPGASRRRARHPPLRARARRSSTAGRSWLAWAEEMLILLTACRHWCDNETGSPCLGEPGDGLFEALAQAVHAGKARRPAEQLLRLGVAGPQPINFAALRPERGRRPARSRSSRPSVRRSCARYRRSKSRTRCRY